MGPHNRGTNPEEEYFARREGERERDRDEAERKALDEQRALPPQQHDESEGSAETPEPRQPGTTSRIVGAMSTAMKALFGVRGNRRPRHA